MLDAVARITFWCVCLREGDSKSCYWKGDNEGRASCYSDLGFWHVTLRWVKHRGWKTPLDTYTSLLNTCYQKNANVLKLWNWESKIDVTPVDTAAQRGTLPRNPPHDPTRFLEAVHGHGYGTQLTREEVSVGPGHGGAVLGTPPASTPRTARAGGEQSPGTCLKIWVLCHCST